MKTRATPQRAVRSDVQAAQQQDAEAIAAAEQEFGPRPNQRFGALRQKLNVEDIPGHIQRWINDVPGRVDYSKECGYSHITDDQGKPIYRVVNKGGMRAYRMKIPQVWYDQNKAEEQEEHVDSVERDIWQGRTGRLTPGQNGAYVPTHGPNGPSRIKVTTTVE